MALIFSGARLRNLRIAAGLSAEQLALKISRSVYSIHSYESGRVSPPVSVLTEIAHELGADIADLFTEVANV